MKTFAIACLGLVLVVATTAASQVKPKDGPKKAEPKDKEVTSLSKTDTAVTAKWAAHLWNKSRDFPPGNNVAAKAAADALAAGLLDAVGVDVEWPVTVGGYVSPEGRLGIPPAEVEYGGNGPKRRFVMTLTYTPEKTPKAVELHQSCPSCFPVGSPNWLAKVKKGDKFVIKGKLADIVFTDKVSNDFPTPEPKVMPVVALTCRFHEYEIVPAK
jgi:hypothetical protein